MYVCVYVNKFKIFLKPTACSHSVLAAFLSAEVDGRIFPLPQCRGCDVQEDAQRAKREAFPSLIVSHAKCRSPPFQQRAPSTPSTLNNVRSSPGDRRRVRRTLFVDKIKKEPSCIRRLRGGKLRPEDGVGTSWCFALIRGLTPLGVCYRDTWTDIVDCVTVGRPP